jgi:hypothetical protein
MNEQNWGFKRCSPCSYRHREIVILVMYEEPECPIAGAIDLWMRPEGALPPCRRSFDTYANRPRHRLQQTTMSITNHFRLRAGVAAATSSTNSHQALAHGGWAGGRADRHIIACFQCHGVLSPQGLRQTNGSLGCPPSHPNHGTIVFILLRDRRLSLLSTKLDNGKS